MLTIPKLTVHALQVACGGAKAIGGGGRIGGFQGQAGEGWGELRLPRTGAAAAGAAGAGVGWVLPRVVAAVCVNAPLKLVCVASLGMAVRFWCGWCGWCVCV